MNDDIAIFVISFLSVISVMLWFLAFEGEIANTLREMYPGGRHGDV